jgi:hypothetical protein
MREIIVFVVAGFLLLIASGADCFIECTADLEPDGDVDGYDLYLLINDYGRTNCDEDPPCLGDINGDLEVSGDDLILLADELGRTDCFYCIDNDGDGYGTGNGCLGPDCDDTNENIHPGISDLPDDSFIDSNCDGLDGEVARAVFVSDSYGNDGRDGLGPNTPVRTLQTAINIASSLSDRDYVIIDRGNYYAEIMLKSNVSIYGGYRIIDTGNFQWTRSDIDYPLISGASSDNNKTISGTDVNNIVLDRLEIRSSSGSGYGKSSYAVFLSGSIELIIHKCTVHSGAGAGGASGANGEPGADGEPGLAGQPGCEDSSGFCNSCPRPLGGDGGTSTCGRAGGNGGDAGHGSNNGEAGEAGEIGTLGGIGGYQDDTLTCYDSNISDGGDGRSGSSGGPGAPGQPFGSINSDGYIPSNGQNGIDGSHGNGGGGGGGGRGGTDNCDSYGSSGGGGGSGGCGGTGGGGGGGGGGSFAIWLYNCDGITITESNIITGNGGNGGSYGSGGPGGRGGSGGAGGTYGGAGEQDDGGCGGRGGDGGMGGTGGRGGIGGGGPSIGIVNIGSFFTESRNAFIIGNGGSGGSTGRRDQIFNY